MHSTVFYYMYVKEFATVGQSKKSDIMFWCTNEYVGKEYQTRQ